MENDLNKFNSKSGFDFDVNNITSKIRLDFDTNVENPENYILGINQEQTQFILIDPDQLTNTNITDNTLDLNVLQDGNIAKVKHYVFEKLINPSTVGCLNCDATTDIDAAFIQTGELPILDNEIIAEFEISPSALHTLEIDLVGHRKICDDSGNCYSSWNTSGEEYLPKKLISKPPYPTTDLQKELQNSFIDYTCCPCCDAEKDYQSAKITLVQRNTICESSNVYIKSTSQFPTFHNYCHGVYTTVLTETSPTASLLNICDLIQSSRDTYGTQIDTTLKNCEGSL